MPSVLGVFQRSNPWRGSAQVVVCTRVLSAELDRGVLKSAYNVEKRRPELPVNETNTQRPTKGYTSEISQNPG